MQFYFQKYVKLYKYATINCNFEKDAYFRHALSHNLAYIKWEEGNIPNLKFIYNK